MPRQAINLLRMKRRDHDTGHFEASPANRGTSPQICETQWSDRRGNRNRRVECLSAYSKKAWLSRSQKSGPFRVHIAYSFDRLLEAKLAQAYEILVPCREHPVGVRVKEFDDGRDLRSGFVVAATRGEHDRKPDGVADRVCQEPRAGGTPRVGVRR